MTKKGELKGRQETDWRQWRSGGRRGRVRAPSGSHASLRKPKQNEEARVLASDESKDVHDHENLVFKYRKAWRKRFWRPLYHIRSGVLVWFLECSKLGAPLLLSLVFAIRTSRKKPERLSPAPTFFPIPVPSWRPLQWDACHLSSCLGVSPKPHLLDKVVFVMVMALNFLA